MSTPRAPQSTIGAGAAAATGPAIRFGPDGLLPVVIQEATTGEVLMVGFMNAAALSKTRETGRVHFWSRSRQTIWRKGETSGHEQIVGDLFINCEQNSLLIRVHQQGAVCHDGYPTCFYRQLEADDTMTIVRERAFDPARVYGNQDAMSGRGGATTAPSATVNRPSAIAGADTPDEMEPLERATRLLYGALVHLRDNDLTAVSRTSVRLRRTTDTVSLRVVQELRELAGVLEGTHRHGTLRDDVLLEGTQVLYWILLSSVRADVSWDLLRPDQALAMSDEPLDLETAGRLLRAEARDWERSPAADQDHGGRSHASLALVGRACAVVRVAGLALVEADLEEMKSRSYLAEYFERAERSQGPT